MRVEEFEKGQQDAFCNKLPEMRELPPELLIELWAKYMHKKDGSALSKAQIFNAALAIALRLSRGKK